MKHTILCNNYDNDSLKNVDISSKITSLQHSWVKELYDNIIIVEGYTVPSNKNELKT